MLYLGLAGAALVLSAFVVGVAAVGAFIIAKFW